MNSIHAITCEPMRFLVLEREASMRPMQEHTLPTRADGWSVLVIEVRQGRVAVCLVRERDGDTFYMPMIVLAPVDVTREVLRLRALVEGPTEPAAQRARP